MVNKDEYIKRNNDKKIKQTDEHNKSEKSVQESSPGVKFLGGKDLW